jgi:hypothetical protein
MNSAQRLKRECTTGLNKRKHEKNNSYLRLYESYLKENVSDFN